MTLYSSQATKRQALPIERTVRWLPLDDAYYLLAEVMTSTRAAPLVVMQEALLQVEAHAASEVYGSSCGVLCGGHYRDPKSEAVYLLVEGVERATRTDRGGDPYASLAADLSRAIASAERGGRVVVGWYRFDVALSQRVPIADVGIHRSLFREPWQVALLRDGADGEGSGAFVRVESTEGRAFRIPFFELIPRKQGRGHGPKRTSVQWRNYSAESEVALLPSDAFRDAPSHHPTASGPAESPRADAARQGGLFSGILGRRSSNSSPERPAAAPIERPVFPHPPAQPATQSEAPPAPTEIPVPSIELPIPPVEVPIPPVEMPIPPVEIAKPAAESPTRAAEIPIPTAESPAPSRKEASAPPEEPRPLPADLEPPVASHEALPELPLDVAAQDAAEESPAVTFSGPAAPPDELEGMFADWQPETGEHIVDKPFRDPWLPYAYATSVKRALLAAVLLAAAYFGSQRIRAAREAASAPAAGDISIQQPGAREIAAGDPSGGEVATASAQPAEDGGFTPEQRVEVRSTLARISQAHAALAAHLDTLNSQLIAARSSSARPAACEHASSLYQSSMDDRAKIDLARQKLTRLVGPMRMAGIDSLSRRAEELHPLLQDSCP